MPRTAEDWLRVKEAFQTATDLAPAKRAAFLHQFCSGDEALRREVELLLASAAQADGFIEDPARAIPRDALQRIAGEEPFMARQFGPYRTIHEIGRGGLGTVYLAARSDAAYEKEVAIKLLRRGLDTEDILRRFRNERQILARLEHPSIARLIDGGTTADGLPYFVMEYVAGEPLNTYCDSNNLTTNERLRLFRAVCAAVTYAHQHLVIHRDLKPSNILVTSEGEVKLLDFGIAKLLGADEEAAFHTMPEQRVMTPEYASPEQVRGEAITTASDVYSLGVVLYELLTGAKPYRLTSQGAKELESAITDQTPGKPSTAPSSRPTSLHSDLDNIILMALRKEPARRYTSVGQFSEDIRRYLEGLPVIASTDTFGYRACKFVRRHKTGVAAAALVLLALLGGLVTTARQARIARQERDRARVAQNNAELARKQGERLNSFLQTLLGSANPSRLGRDAKVVEVLDEAGKSLDSELANEPQLRAQAHTTMARAYDSLRNPKSAIRHARAALDLTRRLHGPNDLATAQAASSLGVIFTEYHRFAEAEPLLTEALGIYRQSPASRSEGAAKTLSTLGASLSQRGRAREGLPMATEALEISRTLHGENSAEAIDALNTLGLVQVNAGDAARAEASFRRAVELYDRIPRLSASSIYARLNVVLTLYLQGRIPEVRPVLENAQAICERELGKKNDLYGGILWRLGTLDFMKGDYVSALPLLQRGLDLIAPVFADDQIDMVHVRAMLGAALTRTGDPAAGEPLLRLALANGKNIRPSYFSLTVGSLAEVLGECLLAQDRYAEAEPLLVTGYNDLHTRLGEKHPMSVAAAGRLQQMYLAWHKPKEAARFATQASPSPNPSR